jgi:hypothetical protein
MAWISGGSGELASARIDGDRTLDAVWVFNGDGGTFPSGVFSTRELAEAWIGERRLSGCLTRYPVDVPLYEWAMALSHFEPRHPSQLDAPFIQRFSSAYLEHHHYEHGERKA